MIFRQYDSDGSGGLSAIELRDVMEKTLGMTYTLDEAQILIERYDRDGRKCINDIRII